MGGTGCVGWRCAHLAACSGSTPATSVADYCTRGRQVLNIVVTARDGRSPPSFRLGRFRCDRPARTDSVRSSAISAIDSPCRRARSRRHRVPSARRPARRALDGLRARSGTCSPMTAGDHDQREAGRLAPRVPADFQTGTERPLVGVSDAQQCFEAYHFGNTLARYAHVHSRAPPVSPPRSSRPVVTIGQRSRGIPESPSDSSIPAASRVHIDEGL
jgi:hypothetical protein